MHMRFGGSFKLHSSRACGLARGIGLSEKMVQPYPRREVRLESYLYIDKIDHNRTRFTPLQNVYL